MDDVPGLTRDHDGVPKEADLQEAFGEERAKRYFEVEDGHGVLRTELRRSLIFGRHDLVQDPPISRIDLVACRNTLMYFTAPVQLNVLATLHFALNKGGYLFLGKSEALVSRSDLFESVNLRHRIFCKDGALGRPPQDVEGLVGAAAALRHEDPFGLFDDRLALEAWSSRE